MINIAILGAGESRAGELIRILINHPDVNLRLLWEPTMAGRLISDIHHGLAGEPEMRFTSQPSADRIDIAFKLQSTPDYDLFCRSLLDNGGKIVDMAYPNWHDFDAHTQLFGLSEINRKRLVRGATQCILPRPLETAILVTLFPLASHLLLTQNLKITSEADPSLLEADETAISATHAAQLLRETQQSFTHEIEIESVKGSNPRCLSITVELPCSLSADSIMEMYHKLYDDHNFVVAGTKAYSYKEVEGTNRCIITITKPDPATLRLKCILDARLRGCAGEAVHALNLLFGLHEKTGLTLKASAY